jgi:hypothetical protein
MGWSLTGSIESRVRGVGLFLPIIEENTPQIFEQFDKNRSKKFIYLKFERTPWRWENVPVPRRTSLSQARIRNPQYAAQAVRQRPIHHVG